MKKLLIVLCTILAISGQLHAADYGDKGCNIFVSDARNVITGGHGNYLSATILVSKDLINRDFQDYKVIILGSEAVQPTKVEDKGRFLEFTFDKYANGIGHHSATATIVAFITNGIDRLFDNNDIVNLVPKFGWYYTNPRCK
mgnify:FL=1